MARQPLMLASDLDGTLIPTDVDGARGEEIRTFRTTMQESGMTLAYVTGRGRDLALKGIRRVGLPLPDVLVCDVGTSVWVRRDGDDAWFVDEAYQERMREALGGVARADIVGSIGAPEGLELQEPPKQTDFKISYYVAPDRLEGLRDVVGERLARFPVPPKAVWSHDPYSGRMLLDVLPRNVAKHVALGHLRARHDHELDEIVYAGDSGNDFDALLSGHPAIVVANAPEALKQQLREQAGAAGTLDRMYFAERPFAGGVLEGLRHFGAL